MSSNEPLIQFNPKLPKLSDNEKQVLDLLVEAGKLIAPLYLEQENQEYPGANFYPNDVTKEEIEEAAKSDPQILSPYTIVERDNGKLVAVPYHIKYEKYLKPIAEVLEKAAQLTENKEFGEFLSLRAKCLLEGNYEKAFESRLRLSPYKLDISIGPISHYDDHLFNKKASYHAWVGILDQEGTDRLLNYKSITLGPIRKGLNPENRIDDSQEKVRARVLDVVLLSGLMERTRFVGIHLPTDINLIEKFGSEVVLLNQTNDLRVKEQILPIFEKIFSNGFKEGFTEEDLNRGYLRGVALHELAHSYLLYRNAQDRLQDLFPIIDELAATILGLRMGGSLLLKDRITDKQLESMVVTFICRSIYHKEKSGSNFHPMSNYALGGSIFVNFMMENGAIKTADDTLVLNFMKIFVSLTELSDSLELLLSSGSYQEAQDFVKKYTL